MLSSVTLDDATGSPVTIHTDNGRRQVSSATGLIGVGSPRDSRRVRPSAHGGIDETRWEDGRLIVLQGEVAFPGSVEGAFDEFRSLTSPMLETWDVAPALLKWTEGSTGLALQRLVKLASDVDPELTESAALLRYQAQFFAEDPRAYSQTLTTATGDALFTTGGFDAPFTAPITVADASSGTVAVNNLGNRPTPAVFRVYGYATNPQIILVGANKRIALTGVVAPGDFLELDTQARTIRLNGTSPAQSYLDSTNTQWFDLPKGTSTIQLTVGANDAVTRCDVLYRSAYA